MSLGERPGAEPKTDQGRNPGLGPESRIHAPTIQEGGIVRPTYVEIDSEALAHNFRLLREISGSARVMPILKANAYGHGLVPVAERLCELGCDYLGVAMLEEGLLLRQRGITAPILVLGAIMTNQIPLFIEADLTLTASSVDKLKAIDDAAAAAGRKARVHLKIDTGMERVGVHYYSAEPFLRASVECRHIQVEGIYSHLACANDRDLTPTRLQIERFLEVAHFYERNGLAAPLRHIAGSAAMVRLPESRLDLVRPGILLFGVYPSRDVPRELDVRPVLSWKSRVAYFKVVKAGSPVSYGWSFRPLRMTRIVTIPVGYGDGYPRSMSGKAQLLIRGKRYPVVGRICMDQLLVDIGWETAYNGDEVVLIGSQGEERIAADELADWAGTISYEILTGINTRVPRLVKGVAGSSGDP